MATIKIDQFEIVYSANQFPPRIWLWGGGRPLGQLLFMPNGSTLPPDTMVNNQVNLHYHLENLETMMTLFRGEKTLYLQWNGPGPGFENSIQTTPEPLGT